MTFPTCREIRNQVIALAGFAAMVWLFTSAFVNATSAPSTFATIDTRTHVIEMQASAGAYTQAGWDDMNVMESVASPEDEVSTARSKMLQDFEAR